MLFGRLLLLFIGISSIKAWHIGVTKTLYKLKPLFNADDKAVTSQHVQKISLMKNVLIGSSIASMFALGANAVDETVALTPLTRADVGFINLNESLPTITDVCWLDLQIENSDPQRIEISLFGEVAPKTVENFKGLCKGDRGYGYKGSNIFRIISQFSVQGGNINNEPVKQKSQLGKEGKSAFGEAFAPENYKILHSYEKAGVVSMMKDLSNRGLQDSRFFVTLEPYASWADDKYSAFGLITKGMNFITGLTILPVQPPSNYPISEVKIINSGCY